MSDVNGSDVGRDIQVVYVTVGNAEEGRRIAHDVVSSRLAACVNILPGVTSVYEWKGAVQQDEECVLFMKTEKDRLAALTQRITELHSYECPCVVSWPLGQGHAPFLEWVQARTRP